MADLDPQCRHTVCSQANETSLVGDAGVRGVPAQEGRVTRDELDFCYRMVLAAWPHAKPVPETFTLAERLLMPMDARAVAAAIEQFSLDGREFAPTMGQVAKRAQEVIQQVNGTVVPDGQQALSEVYDRIGRCGRYQVPEWTHPAIGAAVEAMGGWEATCGDDNRDAYRAHFLRLYDTMKGRLEREALVAPAFRELLDSSGPRIGMAADLSLDAG